MDSQTYMLVLRLIALVICLTIHEFSHAYSAYLAGDDTARANGRISLNPLDHLDPLGTIFMVVAAWQGFGIGWAKPVPVNPHNFKHPRWDNLKVSLWGPLSNLLTAAVLGTALRFTGPQFAMSSFGVFLDELVLVSVALAVFNMIPIPPLDGSHILSSLLPYESARQYDMVMGRYGMLIFIGLLLGPLGMLIGPPMRFFYHLFTGG
jgi:Zn-dependent protease